MTRTSPPLLQHSETDPTVPFEHSLVFEARYKARRGAGHAYPVDAPKLHDFWNCAKYSPTAMEQAASFLHRTFTPRS